jgi:hypothetical protein
VTWAFLYLVAIVFGLVLAGVTGLLRELPIMASHRHLVVPLPDQHFSRLNVLGRRAGVTLLAFGAVGLVLQAWNRLQPHQHLLIAVIAAIAASLLSSVLLHGPCAVARSSERAVVLRDIPPGGYGQVRLGHEGSEAVVAARSVDDELIPAGSEVEVVDCSRSVISVARTKSEVTR